MNTATLNLGTTAALRNVLLYNRRLKIENPGSQHHETKVRAIEISGTVSVSVYGMSGAADTVEVCTAFVVAEAMGFIGVRLANTRQRVEQRATTSERVRVATPSRCIRGMEIYPRFRARHRFLARWFDSSQSWFRRPLAHVRLNLHGAACRAPLASLPQPLRPILNRDGVHHYSIGRPHDVCC
jgi:hypothetical protein